LSSAILYLAIVAIWAGVLIPRWLRRDTSAIRQDADAGPAAGFGAAPDVGAAADVGATADAGQAPAAAPVPSVPSASRAPSAAQAPSAASASRAPRATAREARPAPVTRRGPAPGDGDLERKRVLAARRRLLGMLVALTLGSAALAVMRMAAWWVVVPPSFMLFGYLALLHEAAKADAERRERARAYRAARPAAPRRAAPRPAPAAPGAEIIALSARAPEARQDLYDQHADAKLRAVGD
jgi:hypothetical protein